MSSRIVPHIFLVNIRTQIVSGFFLSHIPPASLRSGRRLGNTRPIFTPSGDVVGYRRAACNGERPDGGDLRA